MESVIKDITIQNLPGGAKISYSLDDDGNLSHVVATYTLDGEEKEVQAPADRDFILLEGFVESKDYILSLKAVDKAGDDSPGMKTIIIHPLEIVEFDKSLFSNLDLEDDSNQSIHVMLLKIFGVAWIILFIFSNMKIILHQNLTGSVLTWGKNIFSPDLD